MSATFTPGTEKCESKYKRMEYLGASLGIPVIGAHVGAQALDKTGTLVQDCGVQRSRTWNRNFWNFIAGINGGVTRASDTLYQAGSLGSATMNGTVRAPAYSMRYAGSAYRDFTLGGDASGSPTDYGVNTAVGIIVGLSNVTESFNAYSLGSLCAHGSAITNMMYNTQATFASAYDAGTRTWSRTITRGITNGYSASQTIRETGIAPVIFRDSGNLDTILIARDVLATPVVVPAGGSIVVTYVISMQFPAA